MISVFVDMAVFVEGESFGRISGSISIPIVPEIGDLIWLNHTYLSPHVLADIAALPLVRVTGRTITANHESEIGLMLTDLVVSSPMEALKAMHGLEKAHGLVGERF